jgi:uncharacterized protein YprB with RNaseH-like and TPR domain
MKIDTEVFLRLAERARSLLFVDIEATGLKGDYNSVLVVSGKPYRSRPTSFNVTKVGADKQVLVSAKGMLEAADAWVTYYGRGFDIKMLNTRLLCHGLPPIEKRPHLDMYYMLKSNTLTGRRSQGHLLSWLKLPEQKMSVSASVWSEMPFRLEEHMPTMIRRCESDVRGLEALYEKTKHLIREIKQ